MMKKITAFLLIVICAVFAVSCGKAEEKIPESETEAPHYYFDVSGAVIVKKAGDESALESAGIIADAFEKVGMERPQILDDTSEISAERQIIVGHTSVPEENEVYSELSESEYAIRLVGEKLIISGYDSDAVKEAAVDFAKRYIGYSEDFYEPKKPESTVFDIIPEKLKATGGKYSGGRTVKTIANIEGDPIVPKGNFNCSGGCRISENEIKWTGTGSASTKKPTEKGAYAIQLDVDVEGKNLPSNIQIAANIDNKDSKHIMLNIMGNFVQVVRTDCARGGNYCKCDGKHYTVRMEVYPDASVMRYYVNGYFVSEMHAGDADYPIVDCSYFVISAVGDGIDVRVSNIHIVKIDEIKGRAYSVPDIEIGNEDVYPKSQNAPADEIYVIKESGLNDDDLLTLMSLQGIVNRTTPRIFLDYRKYNNDARYSNIRNMSEWMNILKDKGRTLKEATLDELLVLFADEYKGVIIGTPLKNNYEQNVITTLCGVLDGVYMKQKRYDSMKDEIKKDVLIRTDGRFENSVDAYMWLWNNYGDKCSKKVLFHLENGSEKNGMASMVCRDYAVMSRAFVFYSTDVECLEDYDFYLGIFASCAPNTAVIGKAGTPSAFDEFEMFLMCGQFAKYFTYGFSTANMSLLNSLEVGELKQNHGEDVELKKGTVYVSFDFTEGDNLTWDCSMWNLIYDKGHKEIPKGYSFCGALWYVAPAIAEYYYKNATENDWFFLDGGGISNISSPDSFGCMYEPEGRKKIMERYFELTEYVCEKMDINTIRALSNISDEMAKKISEKCPSVKCLLSAYSQNQYINGGYGGDYGKVIYMTGDAVRMRYCVSNWNGGLTAQLRNLEKAINSSDDTYFVEVQVYANSYFENKNIEYLKDLVKQLEKADKNIVVVNTGKLAELYMQYNKK